MPHHAERRVLPFSPQQLFDLVADIGRYPEFLPWCVGARVRPLGPDLLEADLIIGFKAIRESFTSHVHLDRPQRIQVEYTKGPLRHLTNSWAFAEHEDGCAVDFHVDFEFRSRLLRGLISPLFHEAVRRMVGAFEGRAQAVYGVPKEMRALRRPV